MKKLLLVVVALVMLAGAFSIGVNQGKHLIIREQSIVYEDGFYYSVYHDEWNEYEGDMYVQGLLSLYQESNEHIIIKDAEWNVLYNGTVGNLQDKELLNKSVTEIVSCTDEAALIMFVE